MIRIFKNRPLLKFRLDESVDNIFDLLKKHFSADVVDSKSLDFEFDSYNLFKIFDILNFHFFSEMRLREFSSRCVQPKVSENFCLSWTNRKKQN